MFFAVGANQLNSGKDDRSKRWLISYENKLNTQTNNKVFPNKKAFGFPELLKNQKCPERKSKISKKDKRNIKETFLNREQQNWQ